MNSSYSNHRLHTRQNSDENNIVIYLLQFFFLLIQMHCAIPIPTATYCCTNHCHFTWSANGSVLRNAVHFVLGWAGGQTIKRATFLFFSSALLLLNTDIDNQKTKMRKSYLPFLHNLFESDYLRNTLPSLEILTKSTKWTSAVENGVISDYVTRFRELAMESL